MSEREIVLSYHNSLIRQSDYKLLFSREWINDNLIEFWFEYLTNNLYKKYNEMLLCISPSLTQLIKLTDNIEEIKAITCSLEINSRKLVLIPINDNTLFESAGGSHWSLLVCFVESAKFEHYDSSITSCNVYHAKKVATKLNKLLPHSRELNLEIMTCNQQVDSYNCGIHVICNAEAVCKKHFHNDERRVSDIATHNVIKSFRKDLIELINNLQN